MAQIIAFIPFIFFSLVMVFATVSDVTTMRIPNKLVLTLLAGYLICASFSGMAMGEMVAGLVAGTAVFCLGFSAFACGWMGGGDVKLMSVTALWLGLPQLPAFVFWTAVFGAILTMGLLIYRTLPLPATMQGQQHWAAHLHRQSNPVPYGAAIGPAAMLVFASTPWMATLAAL